MRVTHSRDLATRKVQINSQMFGERLRKCRPLHFNCHFIQINVFCIKQQPGRHLHRGRLVRFWLCTLHDIIFYLWIATSLLANRIHRALTFKTLETPKNTNQHRIAVICERDATVALNNKMFLFSVFIFVKFLFCFQPNCTAHDYCNRRTLKVKNTHRRRHRRRRMCDMVQCTK